MKNQIEGELPLGSKVVVVEDLISTGGSSLKAVAALREAGFEVVGMVASYTYDGVHLKAQYIPIWLDFLKEHAVE